MSMDMLDFKDIWNTSKERERYDVYFKDDLYISIACRLTVGNVF